MTGEQRQALRRLASAGADVRSAKIFSGDVYLPDADGAPVRVDPDGREHTAAAVPTRGVTLAQDAASSQALTATLRRMTARC